MRPTAYTYPSLARRIYHEKSSRKPFCNSACSFAVSPKRLPVQLNPLFFVVSAPYSLLLPDSWRSGLLELSTSHWSVSLHIVRLIAWPFVFPSSSIQACACKSSLPPIQGCKSPSVWHLAGEGARKAVSSAVRSTGDNLQMESTAWFKSKHSKGGREPTHGYESSKTQAVWAPGHFSRTIL